MPMVLVLTNSNPDGTVDLLIALPEESIERIKQFDPFELVWSQLPVSRHKLRCIAVTFCPAEEQKRIEQLSTSDDPQWQERAFVMLTRGFQYMPKASDHDLGYVELGKKANKTQ
jgi:hypothetical protein